jgi:hypothetical protein
MKEKKFVLQETQAKVYFANKENHEKLKDQNLKVYSEDKDFILVYSEDDIQKILNIYEFMEYQNYEQKKSQEDEIYDNFLEEFSIAENEFDNWTLVGQKIDSLTTIAARFDIDGVKFDVFVNKMDSLNKGSKAEFGLASANRSMLATVALGEKDLEEDNSNE